MDFDLSFMIFYMIYQVRGNESNHLKDDLMSHVNIMLLYPSIPSELVDDYGILSHHNAIYWAPLLLVFSIWSIMNYGIK